MDLHNHLATLKREIQKSRHQIRCAEKAKRRRGARIDEQGGNHFVRLIVLAVYLLSGSSLELAVNCWMRRRRQSHCADEDVSAARGEHLIRLWVDEVDDEFWESLRSRDTAECRKAREEANRFLSNAHAAVWALQNNVKKGHAPTTQQLWDEKERAAEVLQRIDGERSAPSSTKNAMNMWGKKWRVSWNFKYGKLRGRDRHDVEELRSKVPPRLFKKEAFLVPKTVPKLLPKSGSVFDTTCMIP
jgi:hypothetical protein